MDNSTKCFDWASSFYEYSRAIPDDLMRKTLATLQDKMIIDSSSKILEVGIGTGRIAIPLIKNFNPTVVGIDISWEMLQKCQEKLYPADKIQLIIADGFTPPFSDNQFDIILTCHLVHLLSNAYQFIEKISPLLVKNGYYINLEVYVDYHQTLPFQIYYNKLSEAGFRHVYRGDFIRRGLIIYLSKREWNHQEYIIRGKKVIPQNDLVRFLRDRVFSHQRTISTDLHQIALNHLYKELEEKSIDLTKKVFAPAISRLNIFEREKQ
ncbi:MAG: class I SAM-dependent methyltransferase [Candidatus Thorarchaeota archaeon]